MTNGIIASVGSGGRNLNKDVKLIQSLINRQIEQLSPLKELKVDGLCGQVTIHYIKEYQRKVMSFSHTDGRVDVKGATLTNLLKEKPGKSKVKLRSSLLPVTLNASVAVSPISKSLTDTDYKLAANLLGTDIASIRAVADVESNGAGFLNDGKPKILFEGHIFSQFTNRKYDKTNSTLSYSDWTDKYYKGGLAEYKRFESASKLDEQAALKSTSWGKFQIMGFNHKSCGYSKVGDFVKAMKEGESKQLLAFINFLKSEKIAKYLISHEWSSFAKKYNGPLYKKNKYDIKLHDAYRKYKGQ